MARHDVPQERRRRESIAAENQAIAFNGRQYGRIVDFGPEGLSFRYAVDKTVRTMPQDLGATSLDIAYGTHDFILVDLPVRIVADYGERKTGDDSPVANRIRVLSFGELTDEQRYCLQFFLRFDDPESDFSPVPGPGKEIPAVSSCSC